MYPSIQQPFPLFHRFEQLRRELDDVFGVSGLPAGIRSVPPGTVPAINIGRTRTSVEVYAFVPGLDAAKIDVTFDRGVLRISGERTSDLPNSDPQVKVYARERGTGGFSRVISLPDDIDPSHIEARYRDGVLQVSIARSESSQPKRISVQ